ncbi:hypothetical protein [Pleionea mediterranea]|uniref:Uncharacterized protein n=1 Tax=Pleionea mediterranea TaxID=523701 RepID=A0A316FSP1_9GAMM|nr:hypothetical protein [Pleionea mediterranea]PWK51781.1 hypothetical protein C8D97_10596 [Pleionea mediterranea]
MTNFEQWIEQWEAIIDEILSLGTRHLNQPLISELANWKQNAIELGFKTEADLANTLIDNDVEHNQKVEAFLQLAIRQEILANNLTIDKQLNIIGG